MGKENNGRRGKGKWKEQEDTERKKGKNTKRQKVKGKERKEIKKRKEGVQTEKRKE